MENSPTLLDPPQDSFVILKPQLINSVENCKAIPFLGEFLNFLHKFVYKMLLFFFKWQTLLNKPIQQTLELYIN